MSGNDAMGDAQETLTTGLGTVNDQLQEALTAPVVIPATVMALDGLRSRYVLDQMQLTRASINLLDGSPAMTSALKGISEAVASLKATQQSASATTDWVNDAAGELDELMDAVGIAKSVTASSVGKSSSEKKE